ncbi:MAG: hypothetical protein IKQ09_02090 [Bacteroidales bacterium]|nr:hypothetical protein [Bacteroidales bacterium]
MKEQQLKPVVCVMNPDDIYWIKEKKELSKFSGSFLSPYEAKEMETTQGVEFPEIRENVIFMLDPTVKNRYIIRTESSDAYIVERRINAIEVIVSLLGGKNFKVISERKANKSNGTQVEVKVNVGTPKVGVNNNTKVGTNTIQNGEITIVATAEFKGEYSEENYFKAEAIAKQYGLFNEPTISSLLMTRHPDNCNEILKKTYSVNTCKDLKENLEVAEDLKVNVMNAVKVDVDVNVKTSHDERYIEAFEFEVEFGPVKADPRAQQERKKGTTGCKKEHNLSKWLIWIMGATIIALASGLIYILLK